MKVSYFSLTREYEIRCKSFLPENGGVRNVILGVHGFAGDKQSSALEKLALACEKSQTALICFDFPSHGESPVDEDRFTVQNCKSDLLAVADYIKKKYPDARKSVFATSFGGYVTLLAAKELEEFSFVLRAPAVTMPKVLLENVLQISREEFEKMGVVRCGFERPIALPYAFYEDLMAQEDVCKCRILQPTLVLHGACDDVVPCADVEAFVSAQNGVQLRVLPGADHRFKNTGEIETVIRYTLEFLDVPSTDTDTTL